MTYKAKKSAKEYIWDGHAKPTTRREFLAKGLISASGFVIAPSILQVISGSQAFAADLDCAPPPSGLPAFIVVNLSGGAALAANYMPLDRGRQKLASYANIGAGVSPTETMEFQGVRFPVTSKFLEGVRAFAPAATLSKTGFVGTMVQSGDDRADNKLDISGLVSAAGLTGGLLPKLGTVASQLTGVRQAPAVLDPPAPLIVNSVADLSSAIGLNGTAGALARLNANQRGSLLKLIDRLSGSQGRQLASANSASGQTLSKLVSCATGKNIELSSTTNAGIDPRVDTALGTNLSMLWQIQAGAPATAFGRSTNQRIAFSAMVYNAIKGNAAAVGLDLGGYDYHDNTRTTADRMDRDAGQLVGIILQTAALMGKKVFVQVVSDGAAGGPGGDATSVFTSDTGTTGMSYIMAYDPARNAVDMMKNDAFLWQIGQFTSGGVSDANSIVGSPEKASAAAFANYLQFAGLIDKFQSIAPGRFGANELNEAVRFA